MGYSKGLRTKDYALLSFNAFTVFLEQIALF